MKNKEFYKLLKKNKSNSGFTLIELLVGLVMSTIVIGALGFGVMQMLATTQTETSKVKTRNESSRAFNFIADEIKAAQTMDVDRSLTNINGAGGVAANFPPLTDDGNGTVTGTPNAPIPPRLALQVPGVTQRIIYSVAPPQTNTWQGPLVIYRWGPPIDADGLYTNPNNPGTWQNEALIDRVSDENQTIQCDDDGDGVDENVTYRGFYACVVDDDGDTILDAAGNPIVENATDTDNDGDIDSDDTADLNGDGVADAKDGADTDGVSITAKLYFVGDTEEEMEDTQGKKVKYNYKTESQVVARARVAPLRKPELMEPEPVYFESLNPQYGRDDCWTVRNDFGRGKDPRFDPNEATPNSDALQDILTWVHQDNRQPQPLNIDTTEPFTMVASAFGGLNDDGSDNDQCLARGNKYKQKLVSIENDGSNAVYSNVDQNGNDVTDNSGRVPADGKDEIHTYKEKVWHTIEFPEAGDDGGEIARKKATYNGQQAGNADVKGDGTVYIFRDDSTVPDVGGYDVDGDENYEPADGDQPSLKEFLRDPNQDGNYSDAYVNADGTFIDGKLEPNQRLVTFEIGQESKFLEDGKTPNPGFDFQDNMFIMTSDAFLSDDDNSN